MIIAIAPRFENIASEKPFDDRYYFTAHLKEVLDELEVIPLPILSEKHLGPIADMADALILPGSYTDIPPSYYGQEPEGGRNYDVDEFKTDSAAIRFFAQKNKPILGICGGLQSINVHFGGSLIQSIDGHKGTELTHRVKIKADSFLGKTYGSAELSVNSLHCQSVKEVAPGFDVIAESPEGIIEAIQKGNIIGVQWHPEVAGDLDFFKSFIRIFLNGAPGF